MLMPYIIPVLLFITHQHIITRQHIFIFYLFIFWMEDANFTYHPSLIIYYSSTHFLILFFLINTFHPTWMVDAMFIFILVFTSSYFRSVWHPFSCFILRMVYFVLFCVTSLGHTHFPSCSSHTVNTFFPKFLHTEYGSQCCKYIEPPAPKIHVQKPSTANAFWGHHIED